MSSFAAVRRPCYANRWKSSQKIDVRKQHDGQPAMLNSMTSEGSVMLGGSPDSPCAAEGAV